MHLICVSRGSQSRGQAFAERLATKLGSACLGREEILERATKAGIAAGRLELACLKPRGLDERMLLEREHYEAFAVGLLVERALAGPLVYHGRTGHLLLCAIPHVLRLRVVANAETRISVVQERLGLDRAKAKRYVEQVDEDRRRWVRAFYGVEWDSSNGYDCIVNAETASVDNLATAFCSMAQLPEFRETPAGRAALEDLLLASRCRVALAQDDRTYLASFKVRAQRGTVTVTYLPRHARVAEAIPAVIQGVPSVQRILCTMASTRLLWIQETFDPESEAYRHVVEVAERWDAAVDLLRLVATDAPTVVESADADTEVVTAPSLRAATGGVEDEQDGAHPAADESGGVAETFAALVRNGHAGGRSLVRGSASDLLCAVDRTASYSLAVVGEAFLSKGKAARIRLTRELGSTIHERLKVPVIQATEMKEQYLFGVRQLLQMVGFAAVTALVVYLVFAHQHWLLRLLNPTQTSHKLLAAAFVFLFAPVVAYFYGTAAGLLLRLIKME